MRLEWSWRAIQVASILTLQYFVDRYIPIISPAHCSSARVCLQNYYLGADVRRRTYLKHVTRFLRNRQGSTPDFVKRSLSLSPSLFSWNFQKSQLYMYQMGKPKTSIIWNIRTRTSQWSESWASGGLVEHRVGCHWPFILIGHYIWGHFAVIRYIVPK